MRSQTSARQALGMVCLFACSALMAGCSVSSPLDTAPWSDAILAAWNAGDLDALDDVYAAEFIRHPRWSGDALLDGLAAHKAEIRETRASVPDLRLTIDDIFASDDGRYIVTRWTVTGTNTVRATGAFAFSPTGAAFRVIGMGIDHVVGGRAVEQWSVFDNLALLTQLGATINPPTAR